MSTTGVDELRDRIAQDAPDEPALADLAAAYFRSVPPADRAEDTGEVLAAVRAHLSLARLRVPGRPVTAVLDVAADAGGRHPERTGVLVVTDDMPYLIDSVVAELARGGATVHRVIHPVVVVRRDGAGRLAEVLAGVDAAQAPDGSVAESWMNLELGDLPGSPAARELGADLHERITRVLADVAAVDRDADTMAATALAAADTLADEPSPEPDRVGAAVALLRWCAAGNLTFLGYRYDRVDDAGGVAARTPGAGLGVLREGSVSAGDLLAGPDRIRPDAAGVAGSDVGGEHGGYGAVAVVTRASARSTVHQPVHPLYLGVVDHDDEGRVRGEHRFLGVLSVAARHADVLAIPVVQRRVLDVLDRAGLSADSWSGRRVLEVLQTYPRAELLCTDRRALEETATGVLALADRRRVRLFLRRDRYGRYFSAMIYLPRDRYTTETRLAMQRLLLAGLDGRDLEYTARVTEDQLALLHVTVFTGDAEPVVPDVEGLTAALADAALSWTDRLREAATPTERAVLAGLGEPFGRAYQEDFGPVRGIADIRILDSLAGSDDVAVRLHPPTGPADTDGTVERRLTLYLVDRRITLSAVLPVLQSLGVAVVDERPYEVRRSDGTVGRINDFGLRAAPAGARADGTPVDEDDLAGRFADAFRAAWRGRIGVDAFNTLVLHAGLTWDQAAVLRALARYLRQIGISYGQSYLTDVVVADPTVAVGLVRLFETRFDPALDPTERAGAAAALDRDVEAAVDAVTGLDADRILRALLGVVRAVLRTNHFRRDAAGAPREVLALKLDPERIPGVPAPRPAIETFVHSARVEGVHLRFGLVARGGLRWSDRPQDYRTEVLGLVKAQSVKNAVIVPVGAKGGFVVKRPPAATGDAAADRDAQRAEGVACYRLFVAGLLDLVDDRAGHQAGATVRTPGGVVRYDGDDSYLVVAADKGTATFSDLANEVAADYGFWLGDAFASGGSVGYDHKAMGITARGAWESVRRHFRELGRDVARDPVSVVGVGDMSGDVFGNGMLLSEHLRIVAAFDHRHVFVDPDPDPAASFAERSRLFGLARSSWADYDPSVISAGGGVYPRTVKTVPLSGPAAAALGVEAGDIDPTALVRAVLRAPVDLLWNGGIGTYVKAAGETHADVGDRANDAVRVDGAELRVAVVGEGGNLGLTQLGRIEFARAGGRVNTDAVDNSAGVDCSDHEVNIKILLDALVERGELRPAERDAQIAATTDDVAGLVLADNEAQNELLGVARAHAAEMLHVHADLTADLEARGRLDRALDVLPDPEGFTERAAAGEGLTGPELATLMAHVKLDLVDALAATDLPDADVVGRRLPSYFPPVLAQRYPGAVAVHPLRRPILTTMLANEVVDGGGITYVHRLTSEVSAGPGDAVRAYQVVTRVFGLDALARDVEAAALPAATADRVTLGLRRLLDRGSRWFLTQRPQPLAVGAEIQRFSPAVGRLAPRLPAMLRGDEAQEFAGRLDARVAEGVPDGLASRVESALAVFTLLDVVEITEIAATRDETLEELDDPVAVVAELYQALGAHLRLPTLLTAVAGLDRADRWDALARLALRDELYAALRAVTLDVLADTDLADPDTRIAQWEEANASRLRRARSSLAEIAGSGRADLAAVSVAARRLRSMVR